MSKLIDLPNIGKTLADKLISVEIDNKEKLLILGSENALIRLSALENSGVCINMLYALEGAVQGIRWHKLDKVRKEELKQFYKSFQSRL